MTNALFPISRRSLLTGLGATALASIRPVTGFAQARPALTLQTKPGGATLIPGKMSENWLLHAATEGPLRFKRGDEIDLQLDNQLPVPIALTCRGIAGAATAEPLVGRKPLVAGGKDAFKLPLRHAGTSLWDTRLLGDGQSRPSPARAVVVQETEPVMVDRDEVILIEDYRVRPDGSLLAPGVDPKDAAVLFTINGKPALDLTARSNDRLRLRLINGCQRNVIALKFDGQDVRVMAIDGQPAEPFAARNSQVVLAPGTRIDVFIDASRPAGTSTDILLHDGQQPRVIGRLSMSGDAAVRGAPLAPATPLPSNGLPSQIELKNALRIDLTLAATGPDWIKPTDLTANTPAAFRTKPGRTVVLALTNRATVPAIFHIHGHHVRLLDRLDDGWKPFWLDTLALDAGQTQRVAFTADNVGRWLMEAFIADWAAPRLVRWYGVD